MPDIWLALAELGINNQDFVVVAYTSDAPERKKVYYLNGGS